MFAVRPMICRAAAAAAARGTSRHASTSTATAREIMQRNNFKKQWLSDPSTYPIIAIMGGGLCWMLGMGLNALTYKDVQINPNTRGQQMKEFSKDHRVGVLETFVNYSGGVKAEGLGIDHEKWAKEKEEYLKK
jgi:hypothetical protein